MGTIAKLAFKETLYKRIFLIALLMTIAFLVFYGIAIHYSASQYTDSPLQGLTNADFQREIISSQLLGIGLFFANFICVLLTILSGVSSVSSEIESHQIDTWLARPLPRRSVILGKFIGLGGLLFVYAILLFLSILLIDKFFGGPLSYAVGGLAMSKALLLFAIDPLILISVALWLSSGTTTINGGIIMIILFGIGFVGGFVEQIGFMLHNTALNNTGIVSSLIFPSDSIFRKGTTLLFNVGNDPIAIGKIGLFGSASEPSTLMLVYALLYGLFFLWLAIRRFGKRDL